jgi:hypothetical protein
MWCLRVIVLLTTLLVALIPARSTPAGAVDCDRACLRDFTDRYLKALVRRGHAALLAPGAHYTENGQVISPDEGLGKRASALGNYRRYLEDPQTQQAMFVGTLDESGSPALVSLRLGIRAGKIVEVETIVARKGSHPLFAPESLGTPDPLWSTPLGAGDAPSRTQLIAIANSYFEGLERHDGSIVASTPTCRRVENGVQTTQRYGDDRAHCAASVDRLRHIEAVRNRRFPVVDTEHGIVVATVLFDIPDAPAGPAPVGSAPASNLPRDPDDARVRAALERPRMLLLTELFKIENGRIQEIEAVMHNLPYGSSSGWPD